MKWLLMVGTVHRDPGGKQRLLSVLRDIRPEAISLEVSRASIRIRHELGRGWLRLFKTRLNAVSRRTGLSPGRLMSVSRLRGVYEYLRLPYEYRAAMGYINERPCPLFMLDDSRLASSFLDRVEDEILTEDNLLLLAESAREDDSPLDLAAEVDMSYRRAERELFENEGAARSLTLFGNAPDAWSDREAMLSRKLRLLHQGLARRAGQTMKGEDLVSGLIIPDEDVGFIPDTVSLSRNGIHLYIGGWEHLVDDRDGVALYNRLQDLGPQRRLCFQPGA